MNSNLVLTMAHIVPTPALQCPMASHCLFLNEFKLGSGETHNVIKPALRKEDSVMNSNYISATNVMHWYHIRI
jgi:hypothetical protein